MVEHCWTINNSRKPDNLSRIRKDAKFKNRKRHLEETNKIIKNVAEKSERNVSKCEMSMKGEMNQKWIWK